MQLESYFLGMIERQGRTERPEGTPEIIDQSYWDTPWIELLVLDKGGFERVLPAVGFADEPGTASTAAMLDFELESELYLG